MNHWLLSWQNYPPEAWRYIFNVMWYHSCCNYCCLFPPLMDDVTDTCNDDHDDNNIWSLIGSTHSGQFKVRHYDNLKLYSNIWTITGTSYVSRADIARFLDILSLISSKFLENLFFLTPNAWSGSEWLLNTEHRLF